MRFLIARKEYVYYFTQYMYEGLMLVEVDGNDIDFIDLAEDLDYEVLSYGNDLRVGHILIPQYTLKEFAKTFYERRDREDTTNRGLLDEYCELIDDFLE